MSGRCWPAVSSLVYLGIWPRRRRQPPIWDASNQFPRMQYLRECDDWLTSALGVLWKVFISVSATSGVWFISSTNAGQQMALGEELQHLRWWCYLWPCKLVGDRSSCGSQWGGASSPPPVCCQLPSAALFVLVSGTKLKGKLKILLTLTSSTCWGFLISV